MRSRRALSRLAPAPPNPDQARANPPRSGKYLDQGATYKSSAATGSATVQSDSHRYRDIVRELALLRRSSDAATVCRRLLAVRRVSVAPGRGGYIVAAYSQASYVDIGER
jgi:hypothetical protein